MAKFRKRLKNYSKILKLSLKNSTQLWLHSAWLGLAIKDNDKYVAITRVSIPEKLLDSIKAVELLPKFTQDIEDRIEKALDNKPDFGFDFKNWGLAPSRARK